MVEFDPSTLQLLLRPNRLPYIMYGQKREVRYQALVPIPMLHPGQDGRTRMYGDFANWSVSFRNRIIQCYK